MINSIKIFSFFIFSLLNITGINASDGILQIPSNSNSKILRIDGNLDKISWDREGNLIWNAPIGDRVLFALPLPSSEHFEKYGLLKLDVKIEGGPVNLKVFIERPGLKRFVYSPIDPNDQPENWQTIYIDLKQPELDCDGSFKPNVPMVAINLWAFDSGYPEQNKLRKISLRNIRLSKRYLDVKWNGYDYTQKKDAGNIIFEYPLTVCNRDSSSHEITPSLERISGFLSSGTIEPENATIAPGDSLTFKAVLSIPSTLAGNIKSLHCEWFMPSFFVDNIPEFEETIIRADAKILLPILEMPKTENPISLITSKNITDIRERYQKTAWGLNKGNEIIDQAEKGLSEGITIPDGPGWAQAYYYCHEHRCPLEYQGENKHFCTKGKEYRETDFMGVDLDRDYRAGEHNRYTEKAKTFALAFLLTGDIRFKNGAKSIMNQYKDKYFTFDWLDLDASVNTIDKGRIQFAKYMEAPEIKNLIDAYDILKGLGEISGNESYELERKLFLPAIVEMTDYRMDMYNRQALITQVALSAGLVFGNAPLLAFAVDSPYGYFSLRKWSATADGIGHEHGYSQMTVSTMMVEMAETLTHIGINTFDAELKRLIDGTLWWSMPFNPENLSNVFSIADKYYPDPIYSAYSGQSLLYGEKHVSKDWETKIINPPSINFPNSGVSILRRQVETGTLEMEFKWGMPDNRGSFSVLSFGMNCYDYHFQSYPGQFPWGSTDLHHKWQIQTPSHSTIVVDGKNQSGMEDYFKGFYMPHPSEQIFYENGESAAATVVKNDRIYPGVTIWRTACVLDGAYLIVDMIKSDAQHTYDWWFHGVPDNSNARDGFSLKLHPTNETLGKENGYEMVANLSTADTDKDFSADWKVKEGLPIPFLLSMKALNDTPTEIYHGFEWSRQFDKQSKEFMMLRKTKTKNADFVILFEPRKSDSSITRFEKFIPVDLNDNPMENVLGLRLEIGNDSYVIYINPESRIIKTSDGTTGKIFSVVRN